MKQLHFISNKTRIFILAVLLLFALAQFTNGYIPSFEKVQAVSRSITLLGSVSAWNASSANPNPTITVSKDDIVTVSLVSSDGAPHRFLLDMDRDGAADTADCPTVDPCSITFPPNTSFSFTAGATGTYTYYCTIHPTTMLGSFVVQGPPPTPDFSLSISPATQSITAGASASFAVTVQSLNSFAGTVNITSSVAPTNPSISANPRSVTLSAGGSGTLTVTVTTTASSGLYSSPTPNGSYTVTVAGTSGATSHSTTATVNVGPQGSTNPSSSMLDPLLLGGVVGAILIAIIAIVGVYTLRRRPRK